MKCPHCLIAFHESKLHYELGNDIIGSWLIESSICPNCTKFVFNLVSNSLESGHWIVNRRMVHPKGSLRSPAPIAVPEFIAADYKEACLVLSDSPKASAALSRRCLQNILLDKGGVVKGDLSKQIQTVIDSGKLPSHLSDDIDAIRNIGNFAAHPNKSNSTGEILEVEPNEAEWNLEVLEALFDFYYVQPEKARLRREALNAKLIDSGKPTMK